MNNEQKNALIMALAGRICDAVCETCTLPETFCKSCEYFSASTVIEDTKELLNIGEEK